MRILSAFVLAAAAATSGTAFAEPQADSFANIYASICLKHLANLDALRASLKDMPALPAEKATLFLQGKPGDAWPVPDRHGVFVVAVPKEGNTCSVFARRVNAQAAEALFVKLVQGAPPPLVSRQTSDERGESAKNAATRNLAYEWSVPQAPRKMLFMLTTATAESAEIQGLATASMVQ